MPNLAFQIEVLKQVIRERAASGDVLAASLNQNNFQNPLMQFAVLGAMGPDVLRYMPISSALASFLASLVPSATSGVALSPAQILAAQASAQAQLQGLLTGTQAQQALAFEMYFNPLGAAYSVLFSTVVKDIWPIFNHVTDILNQLDTIVQNKDTIALFGMLNEVKGLQGVQKQMVGVPATVAVLQVVLGSIIAEGPWMEMNQPFPLPSPSDATLNRRYEFLRWHHTGRFAKNLWSAANLPGSTPNQKAFAFGWLCHVSSSVTSEPMINNIVGGPYRTHWWRNRLAGNFVDSWTFGFFEQSPLPTMSGDDPTPQYADPQTGVGWPSICTANLQNQFNVANLAGPSTPDAVPDAVLAMASGNIAPLLSGFPFPSDIANLLNNTLNATYTVPLGSTFPLFAGDKLPNVGLDATGTKIPAFASDTFARAYIGAFAVYWFMTGGSGPIGNNPAGVPTGLPEPGWISSGSTPSPQEAGVNVGAAICALLLAFFGFFGALASMLGPGFAALAALIQGVIDWTKVANELFWLRKIVTDQENILRDALVWTALSYPPPVLLGMVDPHGNTLPVTDLTQGQGLPTTQVPATQGVPLCKTNTLSSPIATAGAETRYPRWLDTTSSAAPRADLNWVTFPTGNVPVEQNATNNVILAGEYPKFFIQNAQPVANGGMMAGEPTPRPLAGTTDRFLGDAVANAVQLITTAETSGLSGLVDYNLDADRGYGWQTWDPVASSNPFNLPVAVTDEP